MYTHTHTLERPVIRKLNSQMNSIISTALRLCGRRFWVGEEYEVDALIKATTCVPQVQLESISIRSDAHCTHTHRHTRTPSGPLRIDYGIHSACVTTHALMADGDGCFLIICTPLSQVPRHMYVRVVWVCVCLCYACSDIEYSWHDRIIACVDGAAPEREWVSACVCV